MAQHAQFFVAALSSLAGAEMTKKLTISMLTLTVYDYAITLEQEVSHFWQGPFTISHALFFFNRYIPACIITHATMILFVVRPSIQYCTISIDISMISALAALGVIQAILITRVWFLFPGQKHIYFALIFFFVLSLITSTIFLFLSLHNLTAFDLSVVLHPLSTENITGCHAERPADFWRVYLPSLFLHTGLYLATAYNAITKWNDWHQPNLRRRLLRDGGILYLIVFGTVGFVSIGSFLTNLPQINIPAIFSPVAISITSIATNRIMFSLRDITAKEESSLEWTPIYSSYIASKTSRPISEIDVTRTRITLVHDEEKGLWHNISIKM